MGSKDVSQKFTFKEIESSVGRTEMLGDRAIQMTIVSDANGIHESAHGFQMYKTPPSLQGVAAEPTAYQRQYSFDAGTVTNIPSVLGSVSSRNNITERWVACIYDPQTRRNLYAPDVSTKDLNKMYPKPPKL